jgi:hypothetical protein
MELQGDVGHVKSRIVPFRDTVGVSEDRFIVCVKHTVGPEIVLGEPDSTPW